MVSASVVPHHHHEGAVCVELEHRHQHGEEEACVVGMEYTGRYDREDDRAPETCVDDFEAPYVAATALPGLPKMQAVGERTTIYHPVDALSGVGLRAPPAHLC